MWTSRGLFRYPAVEKGSVQKLLPQSSFWSSEQEEGSALFTSRSSQIFPSLLLITRSGDRALATAPGTPVVPLPPWRPNYWTEHSTATCGSHCTPDLDGPGRPCRVGQFSTGCLDNCTAGRRSEFILFYYGGDLLLINKLNILTCHPNSQQTFSSYSGAVTHLKSKIQDIW